MAEGKSAAVMFGFAAAELLLGFAIALFDVDLVALGRSVMTALLG